MAAAQVPVGPQERLTGRAQITIWQVDKGCRVVTVDRQVVEVAGRGVTYWLMERYGEALADINHAIELSPSGDTYAAIRDEIHRMIGEGGKET